MKTIVGDSMFMVIKELLKDQRTEKLDIKFEGIFNYFLLEVTLSD